MRTTFLFCLACAALMSSVDADEKRTQADFRKHRAAFEERLASPIISDRVAALEDLKQFPHLDVVKLALPFWSKDASPNVRAAAADLLLAFKDEAALRPVLFDLLKKELTDANAPLVAVWLAGATPDEQRALLEPLAKLTDRRPAALQPLFPVADYLATRSDTTAVAVFAAFAKLPAFKSQFGFRRAVVLALTGVRHADAVTQLLDLLPELDGETRGDVLQYLVRISGQALGNDVGAWQTWWTSKKANFEFPALPPPQQGNVPLQEGLPSYYGIPIYAKKVIFVIDTSGSMAGSRIASAKLELVKAVTNLPASTSFNMVAFNSNLSTWSRKLVDANSDAHAKAVRWVNQQQAAGATFTYDALKATLDQHPEAIYLLTDGQPTGGALVAPADILAAIKQTNRYRRTTIHVIGVDPGPEDGVFSQFLKNLAAQNWGQYRRVD